MDHALISGNVGLREVADERATAAMSSEIKELAVKGLFKAQSGKGLARGYLRTTICAMPKPLFWGNMR